MKIILRYSVIKRFWTLNKFVYTVVISVLYQTNGATHFASLYVGVPVA